MQPKDALCDIRRSMIGFIGLVALVALSVGQWFNVSKVDAQSGCGSVGQCVVAALTKGDVYVEPATVKSSQLRATDRASLQHVIQSAAKQGVAEKIAVSHYPDNSITRPNNAASDLRHFLDFPGVLIFIAPNGIGVSSDTLNLSEIQPIEDRAAPFCYAKKILSCASMAGAVAASQVVSEQNSANRNRALFWLGALVLFGGVIGFLIWSAERSSQDLLERMNQSSAAGQTTTATADDTLEQNSPVRDSKTSGDL